jgi:hypothetical protein
MILEASKVLSNAEVDAIIAQITYKPGFAFSVARRPEGDSLLVSMRVRDVHDCKRTIFVANNIQLPPMIFDENHLLALVHRLLVDMELHELDEWLCYRSKQVKDPHE